MKEKEVVEAMRYCANSDDCYGCRYEFRTKDRKNKCAAVHREAADIIERLSDEAKKARSNVQ